MPDTTEEPELSNFSAIDPPTRCIARSRSRSRSRSSSSVVVQGSTSSPQRTDEAEVADADADMAAPDAIDAVKEVVRDELQERDDEAVHAANGSAASADRGPAEDLSKAGKDDNGRRGTRGARNNRDGMSGMETEIINIADEDASFILGAGGRTKRKLSRVCGAELNIKEKDRKTILEIRGFSEPRERARLYVSFVMQQRVGPVRLNFDPASRSDLTCIAVPHDCVGYVTGRKGQGLRSIEEEWGTLMFFTDLKSERTAETENLAIFSPDMRKRRGAELKVMSAVEQKIPGYFTKFIQEDLHDDNPDFTTDTVAIAEDDYSYALGREGLTRRKLARSSGAVLEYVGRMAYIAGLRPQRIRAREYLQWLCAQRTSYVHVVTDGRADCTVVPVPTSCVAYVTGAKGSFLRRIEEMSGTFIFLDGTRSGNEEEKLLIFGEDATGRHRARSLVVERIEMKLSGRSTRPAETSWYRSRSRSLGRTGGYNSNYNHDANSSHYHSGNNNNVYSSGSRYTPRGGGGGPPPGAGWGSQYEGSGSGSRCHAEYRGSSNSRHYHQGGSASATTRPSSSSRYSAYGDHSISGHHHGLTSSSSHHIAGDGRGDQSIGYAHQHHYHHQDSGGGSPHDSYYRQSSSGGGGGNRGHNSYDEGSSSMRSHHRESSRQRQGYDNNSNSSSYRHQQQHHHHDSTCRTDDSINHGSGGHHHLPPSSSASQRRYDRRSPSPRGCSDNCYSTGGGRGPSSGPPMKRVWQHESPIAASENCSRGRHTMQDPQGGPRGGGSYQQHDINVSANTSSGSCHHQRQSRSPDRGRDYAPRSASPPPRIRGNLNEGYRIPPPRERRLTPSPTPRSRRV